MRIAIIGSGSMGSLFGALLTEVGHEVILYDIWKAHIETMVRDGLRVDLPNEETRTVEVNATTDPADLDEPAVAAMFTKVTDTANALEMISSYLEGTDVLTVQNGFGNAEMIAEYIPEERIITGVTEASADLEAPGHITHTGTGVTTIGRYFVPNDAAIEGIRRTLVGADIETQVVENPRDAIWRKALVILAFNPISALSRRPVDNIWNEGRDLVERVVAEVVRVAEAEDRDIGDDPVGHVERVAKESSAHHTSMLQDVEAGRPTEIDYLNGEVVRRAANHGIPVPVNEMLTSLIRLLENSDR
jgi:2-dehydropantoate 2-reductase